MIENIGATKGPDQESIRFMFDRLARRYDWFNHLTGMGMATRWRKHTLAPVGSGARVLDLGCGTGDLALEAAKKTGVKGHVVGLDFSQVMLDFARQRTRKARLPDGAIRWLWKRAEELPLDDEAPFDFVVSGFVLRNLYENIDAILQGAYHSLKSGGQIRFLDITEPPNPFFKKLWKFYMQTAAAFYGKMLFGKDYPAFYLIDSAARFVKPDGFVEKLKNAGFRDIRVKSFMFGVIVLYQAER